MKDFVYNLIKKQWLLLWVILAALTLTIIYVSAEYRGENSVMKHVVIADSEQQAMFSSNILKENGKDTYQPQYLSVLTDSEKTVGKAYDVSLLIWNYSRTNPSKWYPQDINYTLTATLVNSEGTQLTSEELGDKTITILRDNAEKCVLGSSTLSASFSDVLTYKTSGTTDNAYTVRFSNNWDLQNDTDICVQLVATPDKGENADKYRDIKEISAIVGLRELQSMGSSGWQVYLNEQRSDKQPNEYDAYNLVVTGSGKADITLTIDTNKLAFNKYFYDKNLRIKNFTDGEVTYTEPNEKGLAKLTIKADSSANRNTGADKYTNPEYRNRYDIQIYKSYDNNTTDTENWNFIAEDNGSGEMPEGVWLMYKISLNEN